MKYTIYKTPEILRVVSTTDISMQLKDGEFYIVGDFSDAMFYMDGDTPKPKGNKPSAWHEFDYDLLTWVDKKPADFDWNIVRKQRDQKLKDSDWTQLPDVPLATKEAWATYRQALRDITNQPDPFTIIWPTKPE